MDEDALLNYCRARIDGVYIKNDADAINFSRELTHVISQTYDEEFPELEMANGDVIPIDRSVPSGAESYTYYTYRPIGFSRVMNTYAGTSIPRIGLAAKKSTGQIASVPNVYGWNLQDLRASQMSGQKYNLRTDQASASKRATMQTFDAVGWFGDAEHNLLGFLNHPNVTHTASPVGGTSGQVSLLLKDPDEILADYADLINTPSNLSKGVEQTTHVITATEVWSDLGSRPRSSTSDTTIAAWLEENHKEVTFSSSSRLNADAHDDSAEFAGESLMVAYTKRKGKGELVVPQDYEQLPPQDTALETLIYTHARVGGVLNAYPLSTHVHRDITGTP